MPREEKANNGAATPENWELPTGNWLEKWVEQVNSWSRLHAPPAWRRTGSSIPPGAAEQAIGWRILAPLAPAEVTAATVCPNAPKASPVCVNRAHERNCRPRL